jgi:hypothetical protein
MGQHRGACQGQVQDLGPGGRYAVLDYVTVMINAVPLMWTGSGGLSVAQQLYDRFGAAGKPLKAGDIAIVDAAEYHHYQVCPVVPLFDRPSILSALTEHATPFRLYSLDGMSDHNPHPSLRS